jgi:nucleoid-associated protein YgaU
MFLKGSRYAQARRFAPDDRGELRCRGVRERAIGPAPGVVEHLVKEGDRLDLLARHYYNDMRLWWRILDANPDLASAVELSLKERVGDIILIPKAQE